MLTLGASIYQVSPEKEALVWDPLVIRTEGEVEIEIPMLCDMLPILADILKIRRAIHQLTLFENITLLHCASKDL